jgi:tetratricopeptide (TPR) repeat protein
MAAVDLDQKKLAEAEQEYKAAIASDSKRAKSYVQLAFVYIGEKKDGEAPALFRKAVEIDANYLPGYFGVARSNLLSGQNLDDAERFFKKYLSRWPEEGDPSPANAHWRLARSTRRKERRIWQLRNGKKRLRWIPNTNLQWILSRRLGNERCAKGRGRTGLWPK